MLATATQNNTAAIRNYAILAASIIFMSAGLTDLFFNPSRVGQQDKIDTYSNVISAGLVSQANNLGR
jgi:hypothetical protein